MHGDELRAERVLLDLGERAGRCLSRPQDCIFTPAQIVCGCDGKLYMSPCEANGSGVDVASSDAGCATPPGTFRCGTKFCPHGTQYCQAWYTAAAPAGNPAPYVYAYACADLAAGCGAPPTCACVTSAECGGCTVSADGDLTAMCTPAAM